MLLTLAVLLLSPSEHVPVAVAEAGAEAVSAHLLSEADNARIVGRSLGPSMNSRHAYKAVFWEAPQASDASNYLCTRQAHRVYFLPSGPASRWRREDGLRVSSRSSGTEFATVFPYDATSDSCAGATGWAAAGERSEVVAQHMSRLIDAVEAARGPADVQFRLDCRPAASVECGDPRRVLATLPLDRLADVRLESDNYEVIEASRGASARRMAPDANGQWPRAVFSFEAPFGVSEPWTVTLTGADELQGVSLRRITMVRF